jgi:DNA-binding CsgD family transcriptional regulator
MPAAQPVLQRVARELAALADRDLTPHELRSESMERISDALPTSGWCFATADPDSLVMTSHLTRNVDRSKAPLIYHNEYAERDVGKHADLALARRPVRVLSRATKGDLESSPRYREVLRPMGVEHELRAAVRHRGMTWGFLHLFRGPEQSDFTPEEAEWVERVTRTLAEITRRSVVGRGVEAVPASLAPSLMLIDEDNRLVEGTPGGHAWAGALRDPEQHSYEVPEVVVTLAVWARVLAAQGSTDVARSRIPGTDGAWYTAQASSTDQGRVAVIVQGAQPSELVGILLSRLGLTPAERKLTELVLAGRSTSQIAEDLVISPYTVQDRLKSIFDKAGVRSRRDLVAQLSAGAA